MTASFGTPAPLPGQPGFRARPSESMARETAEMEERLARLKTDLAAEAEMREAAGPRAGGARWRSARTDRGSVRAYAKDVKIRHKQQQLQRPPHGIFATSGSRAGLSGGGSSSSIQPQAGAGARAAAALRDEQQQHHQQQQQQQQQQQHKWQAKVETEKGDTPCASRTPQKSADDQCAPEARPRFASKEVSRWGVGDTLEWLDSLGLGKHRGVFQQNEISGPILLEVGLDDLDYMDIRVLAHRKRILKGIEDLRRGGGRPPNADMPPPPAPTPMLLPKESSSSGGGSNSGSLARSKGAEVGAPAISVQQSGEHGREGGNHRLSPGRRKMQHWSTIKPLSENQTEEDMNGGPSSPAINLADGQYDEAAAHSSFADAVAEWRGEGRHATTTTTTKTPAPSLHRPSLVGRAPLAGTMPAGQAEEEDIQLLGGAKPGGKPSKGIRRGLLGGGGRGGSGGAAECWTNPFSSPRESEQGAVAGENLDPKPNSPPRRVKTVIVVDAGRQEARGVGQNDDAPALDEKSEHEAFRRAVAEWNQGGDAKVKAERDGGGGGDDGSAASRAGGVITTTTEALPSRRTTEAMAEELREQMDAEHRLQAKELEEKKRALLDGLDAAAEERRSIRKGQLKQQQQVAGESADRAIGGSSSHEFKGESGGGAVFDQDGLEQGKQTEQEEGGDAHSLEGDDDRSTVSSARSFVYSAAARRSNRPEDQEESEEERLEEGAFDSERRGLGGGVEIELMESVLGADLTVEGGVSYVVDEGDSGDEL